MSTTFNPASVIFADPFSGFDAETHSRCCRGGYQSIITADGQRFFVDRKGLIDGDLSVGPHRGERRRDHLQEKPKAHDILAVMRWIEERGLIRRKSATLSSYAAKHYAERFLGRYIPNGAAILAFDALGFAQYVKREAPGQLNTRIGVSTKSYKNLPEFLGMECAGGRYE